MSDSPLTQAHACHLFVYNAKTGGLTWKNPASTRVKPGDAAGHINQAGYLVVKVNGKAQKAHRIVWLMKTGVWPTGDIDHINGVRSDNRWGNLRDVSRTVNQQNQKVARSNNSVGFLGVSKNGSGFGAALKVNRRQVHLGTFSTPEAAHEKYVQAKREFHEGCTI